MSSGAKKGLARGLTNYGDPDFALYLRRSFARSMGYSGDLLARPVVGIADSSSGFNNCHRHFPELIAAVERGVLAEGGLPLRFPTISLGEVFLNPTSLMFRNLMAMDTEEMIRAQPMDAVVLVGGCDKTVPAQLMGAISANRPAIGLVGGSTNAVLHLTAIAGRAGVDVDLRNLNEISDATPVLVDLKPTGPFYMEDLFAAGGIGAVLRELQPQLHLDCLSVAGETLGERLAAPVERQVDREVVRPLAEPLQPVGGLVALFGSLAPKGAIFKRSAADPKLFEKEGRAVVFTSLEDLSARIDDPGLDVTPDDFLVLQNAGPLSASGMPEAGYLPIPAKLARAGVRDMVRISDARMSGTAYGSIVLHVTPDSASGGPLAKLRNGDRIRLSVKERRIDLLVPPDELARRKAAPAPMPERGYARLYRREILQADRGCDFDFLRKHPLGDGRA